MADLLSICARWNLLQPLHPLFHIAESLPSVERAKHGHYKVTCGSATADDYDIEQLENDITTLRADLKLNAIKQRRINSDQFIEDDPNLEGLEASLERLLGELDLLIDHKILDFKGFKWSHEPKSVACFPRLVTLRHLLLKQEASTLDTASDEIILVDDPEESRICLRAPTQLSSFIQFPKAAKEIQSLRWAVTSFGMAINKIQDDSAASGVMEAQYSPQEIETIETAYAFSSTCTSLFTRMVNSIKCGTHHEARLHLTGFKKDQLEMTIGTCQGTDRISAVFTRSFEQPSQELSYIDHLCPSTLAYPNESKVLHVSFNSQGMWPSDSGAVLDSHAYFNGEHSLDHLLAQWNGLTPKYRKLAGVLLAASMFQLNLIDSPWIEEHLGREHIFVPTPKDKQLHHWCPLVLCNLVSQSLPNRPSDHIAAFGVTLLELEAGCKADWSEGDVEYGSTQRSHHVRLARILTSWKDLVDDNHRRVAKACLEFESRIESLDHPGIEPEKKALAVIYKFILEPLYQDAMKSFGNLACLFEDMFGRTCMVRAPMSIPTSATAERNLFDDDDSLPGLDKQITGSTFLRNLDHFFQQIRSLQENCDRVHHTKHKKIRICVLDSGVDGNDSAIRSAIKFEHINATGSKTFVSQTYWQEDTYGHGTHVTNLLLRAAPAAEIYVGKICTSKIIKDDLMLGIAEAIMWAVDKCDADIISISFGFEDKNLWIDEAIDYAIGKGKLIIAAASNNGGLSGRSRPARRECVICIHATDGKGNKGSMNPSPLRNKDNFATLGVGVPSRWKGEECWKSGTSFAVPIAVGFAANILEFARYKCPNLNTRDLEMLHKKEGMQAIFRMMAEERDDYDFIHPNRLWKGEEENAAQSIEKIIKEI